MYLGLAVRPQNGPLPPIQHGSGVLGGTSGAWTGAGRPPAPLHALLYVCWAQALTASVLIPPCSSHHERTP